MTGCEYYQELISRMLDDDLSKAERDELAEHVKRCPDCAAVYVAFRSLSENIGGELEEVPEDLHEKIMSDARREHLRVRNRAATASRRWHYVLTAAACLVLIVAGGLSLPKIVSRRADKAVLSEAAVAAPEAAEPALFAASPQTAAGENDEAEEAEAEEYSSESMFRASGEKKDAGVSNRAETPAEPAGDAVLQFAEAPSEEAAPLPEPELPAGRPEGPGEPTDAEDEDLIVLDEEQSEWLLERITNLSGAPKGAPDRELHLRVTTEKGERTVTLLLRGKAVYYVYAGGDVYFRVDATAQEVLEKFGLDE